MQKFLNQNQLKAFFCAVKNGRAQDDLLFCLTFSLGMRVSEVCRIRIEDIDFNSKQIYINASENGISSLRPNCAYLYTRIMINDKLSWEILGNYENQWEEGKYSLRKKIQL